MTPWPRIIPAQMCHTMTEGDVDINVFVHAQSNDVHTSVCHALLRAAATGDIALRLVPLVLHELTHVLPRYRLSTRGGVIGFALGTLDLLK